MKILLHALILILSLSSITLEAGRGKLFGSSKRTYVKKTPYAGFGKRSSTTGKIKTKHSAGYWKKSNKSGVTYVNSYSRS
jgi:hypothetical protein